MCTCVNVCENAYVHVRCNCKWKYAWTCTWTCKRKCKGRCGCKCYKCICISISLSMSICLCMCICICLCICRCGSLICQRTCSCTYRHITYINTFLQRCVCVLKCSRRHIKTLLSLWHITSFLAGISSLRARQRAPAGIETSRSGALPYHVQRSGPHNITRAITTVAHGLLMATKHEPTGFAMVVSETTTPIHSALFSSCNRDWGNNASNKKNKPPAFGETFTCSGVASAREDTAVYITEKGASRKNLTLVCANHNFRPKSSFYVLAVRHATKSMMRSINRNPEQSFSAVGPSFAWRSGGS